jgi:thioredoxin-like negative regulator of GroEL
MRLVHSEGTELIPTADELALKIKAGLAEAGQGRLRLALERLIEVLTKDRVVNGL